MTPDDLRVDCSSLDIHIKLKQLIIGYLFCIRRNNYTPLSYYSTHKYTENTMVNVTKSHFISNNQSRVMSRLGRSYKKNMYTQV